MAGKSKNKTNLTKDINDLFNINDATLFQQKLNDIIKKYNKLLVQEKLREQYNKKILNNTLTINSVNDQILRNYLSQNDAIEEHNKELSNTLSLVTRISSSLFNGLRYLDDIDGAIKTANLSLGLTRGMAFEIRDNLIDIGGYAASIGASVKSVAEAQVAYNNSLGRNVLLNKENLKSLIAISRGLGLANEFSGEIAGNFETIGLNVENTRDFIEDAITSSGRMGINVNKVLTTMNSAFNRANTFNFSKGITAFRTMVEYSEKFKVNIDSAFNSMEMARTLEGGIEMAAKLMVMGGEFSKQNPFELSFLARNRPEEYVQKLNEMTKGVYFFNQQTKQFQSSAFELDRLRAVAEATGVPFNELNEQAMRLAQVNFAKSKLIGFTEEDKEFISSIAQFDAKTGKFTVSINGNAIDIQKLNQNSIQAYKEMTTSLEKRAQEAMTFNETYNVLINEFKALFLPFIKDMNSVLSSVNSVLGEGGRSFVGGAIVLTPIIGAFVKLLPSFIGGIGNLKNVLGNFVSKTVTNSPTPMSQALPQGKGFSMNLTGAATVLASGAAFLLYAKGVSSIADSYSKLDVEKIKQLNVTLGIGGLAIAASLLAIGQAGTVSSVGLLAIGGTMALIGVGAMAMGKGIEFAANGIGNLIEKTNSVDPKNLMGIGAGIGAISLGIASFTNPFTVLGMGGFASFIGLLTLAKKPLQDLSNTFGSMNTLNQNYSGINTVLDKVQTISTSKTNNMINDLKEVVSELSNMNINSSFLKEFKDLLSKPLKVQFDSKDLKITSEIKVYLDSEQIYTKTLSRLPKDFDLISKNRMNASRLKTFYDQ